jgi:hypothetical protein
MGGADRGRVSSCLNLNGPNRRSGMVSAKVFSEKSGNELQNSLTAWFAAQQQQKQDVEILHMAQSQSGDRIEDHSVTLTVIYRE